MTALRHIYKLLDQWIGHYMLAAILILLSSFVRMLEPKILEVTIDVFNQYVKKNFQYNSDADYISTGIYNLLPNLTTNNFTQVIIYIGIIFLVVSLCRALFGFYGGVIRTNATEQAIKKLRNKLFSHIQLLPIGYHDKNKSGELIQRSTGDVDTIKRFVSNVIIDFVRLIGIFGASFYFMFIIHPLYAFIAISLIPIIFITSYLFFVKKKKVWDEHEAEADKLTSIVSENISGIRVVQAFAQEKEEIRKFELQNFAKYQAGLKNLRIETLFWPFSDLLVHGQVVISAFAGGYFALMGEITVGEMVAFLTYSMMVTWPMQRLGRLVSEIGMAIIAMNRINEILDTDVEKDYDLENNLEFKDVFQSLEFKNVCFNYPNEKPIVNDLSFVINADDNLAIIGPAGSGKSTLIKLLLRFYEPTSGAIYLNGKNIKNISKTTLRKFCGVVFQNSFLFSETIKNNIAYTKPTSSEEEIINVASVASIHDVMHIFPQGYDTYVGEKGVSLSGGQKQRVSLSRTLLENAPLLIMDDATSAVDTETEHNIQNRLKAFSAAKSTIVIAHRITSIKNCNKILVLKEGKKDAFGTAQELLKTNSFYQKMNDLQFILETEIEAS